MAPLTRDTIIPILGSMRITIPADTSMSGTLLEKRLEKALDIAQFAAVILPKLKGDLTPWPEKKSVKQDITRFCTTDPMEANQAIMDGSYNDPTGGRAAFASIRWILVELSEALDQEMKGMILHDKEQKSAVLVMVKEVKALDDTTPMLLVEYEEITGLKGNGMYQFSRAVPVHKIIVRVFLPLQQRILMKLLEMNAPRLPREYRTVSGGKRKASFLVPVGPIDPSALGLLERDNACGVCGKKSSTRCSQCMDVFYCSRECQAADWKSHKKACKSLKGVTWTAFVMDAKGPFVGELENVYRSVINRKEAIDVTSKMASATNSVDPTVVPPNTHGSQPFLLKVQDNHSPYLMMYDQGRTFQAWFTRPENESQWEDRWRVLKSTTKTKGITVPGGQMKIYIWAKRTGDWEMSLALDKVPNQELPW